MTWSETDNHSGYSMEKSREDGFRAVGRPVGVLLSSSGGGVIAMWAKVMEGGEKRTNLRDTLDGGLDITCGRRGEGLR